MPQSSRAKGNIRENRIIDILEALGYYCYASRGSRGIDIIALHSEYGHPHLAVAVVRPSGSVKQNFAKLHSYPMPAGAVPIAVREVNRKVCRWYAEPGRGGHDNPTDAITEARSL